MQMPFWSPPSHQVAGLPELATSKVLQFEPPNLAHSGDWIAKPRKQFSKTDGSIKGWLSLSDHLRGQEINEQKFMRQDSSPKHVLPIHPNHPIWKGKMISNEKYHLIYAFLSLSAIILTSFALKSSANQFWKNKGQISITFLFVKEILR